MSASFVIDCGSRSIKLHSAATGGAVTLVATRSWDPITDARHARRVGELLIDLTRGVPEAAEIHVVGTAAARRDAKVASAIRAACAGLGWSYETLTHEAEAALIRAAFGDREDVDIVNAGGGSIQIVGAAGEVTLLGFGISDLNRDFGLNRAPRERRIADATAFVRDHLPDLGRPFVYSGGELTYLRALGAEVDAAGRCPADEFLRVAALIDAMEAAEQQHVSPFDAGWTSGAVASNAIVRAVLEQARVSFYTASDINIADGIISSLAGRSRPADRRLREPARPARARTFTNVAELVP
jgi:exopolyphosphatase/pppGpp-phosphohydrolase